MSKVMISRLLFFATVVILIVASVFLIYRFFLNVTPANSKYVKITKDGKFSPTTYKIGNSDTFRIKNEKNVNQTVKKSGTNDTVAEIDANSFSKTISLKQDSSTVLYLASDNSKKVTIEVGKVASNSTTTTQKTATSSAQSSPKGISEPLPNTGPGELIIYPILAILGFFLFKFSDKFWKQFIR